MFFVILAVYFFLFPTLAYAYIQWTGAGKKPEYDGDEKEKAHLLESADVCEELLIGAELKEEDLAQNMKDGGIPINHINETANGISGEEKNDEYYNNMLFYLMLTVSWLDFNNWGLIQVRSKNFSFSIMSISLTANIMVLATFQAMYPFSFKNNTRNLEESSILQSYANDFSSPAIVMG